MSHLNLTNLNTDYLIEVIDSISDKAKHLEELLIEHTNLRKCIGCLCWEEPRSTCSICCDNYCSKCSGNLNDIVSVNGICVCDKCSFEYLRNLSKQQ